VLKNRRKAVSEPVVARNRIFELTGDGALVEFSSAINAASARFVTLAITGPWMDYDVIV